MWEQLYRGVKLESAKLSYIIFSKEAINQLLTFQQLKEEDFESGGLLLGYVRKNHFDVRYITPPCLRDHQSRFYFERKDRKHIQILKSYLKKSNGEICYLGEWHTHPEDHPNPSSIDINEWSKIRRKRKYSIVFLIIGRKGFYLGK